jgi:hypothetical protein
MARPFQREEHNIVWIHRGVAEDAEESYFFVGRRSREFYGRDTDKQKPSSSAEEIFRRRPEADRESASPDSL